MSFLEELAKKGIIYETQIGEVKNLAKEKFNGSIDDALLAIDVKEDAILFIKGEYFGIPVKTIDIKDIPFTVFKYIPEDSALYYGFAPLELVDGILHIGIVNPENRQAFEALQFISAKLGIPFKIFLISKSNYQAIMSNYKGLSGEVAQEIDKFEKEEDVLSKEILDKELKKKIIDKEEKIVEDSPIIKIVAVIIRNAIDGNASDIHIEHIGDKVNVRYRVDGELHVSLVLPPNVHSGIISRIKVIAKLRLDEKRKPQDGSFSTEINGRKIDFRVSTMPTYYGEKIAIRILDSEKGVKPLEDLGLSARNLNTIYSALAKPYGLILITGPTGSGKTTTLYSMLNHLDKEKNNIVSLEDPIEYHIPNVNQSQIFPDIGYSFASGLRSILRQDPNIMMVGEIRDKETAQLAIQSALTGHLVISTLHTNNAIGAIPRLIDMGVDPYLIAPTLILSIAQRLTKKACESSRVSVPMDENIKLQFEKLTEDLPKEFKLEIKDTMYKIVPSKDCLTGSRGRIAIFEMFDINKELQSIILKNPTQEAIYKIARQNGMITMKEDAMFKAINGIIPFSEVYNFSSEMDND